MLAVQVDQQVPSVLIHDSIVPGAQGKQLILMPLWLPSQAKSNPAQGGSQMLHEGRASLQASGTDMLRNFPAAYSMVNTTYWS